jgi:hypothetical protein
MGGLHADRSCSENLQNSFFFAVEMKGIVVEIFEAVWTGVRSAPPIVTAIAAAIGTGVAVLGYKKWQPESVGKRKIELSDEILADFYEDLN